MWAMNIIDVSTFDEKYMLNCTLHKLKRSNSISNTSIFISIQKKGSHITFLIEETNVEYLIH